MSILFELERMERLVKDIKALCYQAQMPIVDYKIYEGEKKDGAQCDVSSWEDCKIHTPWTELDSHRWYRTNVVIPPEMDQKHVIFTITTGREGQWDATNPQMLFYINGQIVQGIDVNHRTATLSRAATAGDTYDIAMYAYSGRVKGDLVLHTELMVLEDTVQQFYYDFSVPVDAARLLKNNDPENCRRILVKLGSAADTLDIRKAYSQRFYQSLDQAAAILKKEFYTDINKDAPVVSAIGHTHIDVAWLWTVSQTREKVLRSFSTVLQLMEEYPEYKFMSSQPILYQFVKEQEPELYEKIKERIKEGRWEVDGGMWLESDCNIPNGESLVRQIIKGHRFIKEEFGKESKSLWLPDVFGYSAALPQILNKSGIPYFMTTKIAWNQYNQLPNDTFMWKGIDGSEVFVYMPTACDFDKNLGLNISFTDTRNTTTYTGIINPNMALGTFKRFQNKDLTEDTLMLFGYGDGGGGPTKEMLEHGRRLKYGIPGIPRIEQEFEQEFLDRTYHKIAGNPQMPTWNGELYFEYHRGTYTSIAKNKRYNRKCEILLEQLETLASMGHDAGITYPRGVIEQGWDVVLLNQFHDIIPGTAIREVYEQCDIEYEHVVLESNNALKQMGNAFAANIGVKKPAIILFNTLGYQREDLITVAMTGSLDVAGVEDAEGNVYDIQCLNDNQFLFFAKNIPSMGYKVFYPIVKAGDNQTSVKCSAWDGTFENQYFKAVFNQRMELISLFEKASKRELLKAHRVGNELCVYEDRPMEWDNWDIDIYYQKKPYEADTVSEPEIIENGPLRIVVRTRYQFVDSVIIQDVHLYRDIPRIDFCHQAEWREHHTLLKVNFPADINTTRATYEIQYGNTERETTSNHSWDTAKFETCGHKWADLSEHGRGISLLNDCKYGHSIKDGEMALTLIKSGTYPNEEADIGSHEYTYSIYPHSGRWQEARTVEMAYNLNVPVIPVIQERDTKKDIENEADKKEADKKEAHNLNANILAGQESFSMLTCDKQNCFIETMKEAEDGNGYIVRMYENVNGREQAKMTLGREIRQVYECDLLERNLVELEHEAFEFTADFAPYEIKTFRLIFK